MQLGDDLPAGRDSDAFESSLEVGPEALAVHERPRGGKSCEAADAQPVGSVGPSFTEFRGRADAEQYKNVVLLLKIKRIYS